jgi:superfamily I DNA/RNA helicase
MFVASPDEWMPVGVESLECAAEEAVREINNNILLTAGPGGGKTELLAQRACFLLQTGLCSYPKRILAISFKRDAARNLKERVELRCGKELARRFDSMTYDAFAKKLLDRFQLGLPADLKLSKDYQIDYNITKANQMREILATALGRRGYTDYQIQSYDPGSYERNNLTSKSLGDVDSAALLVWRYLLNDLSPSRLTFPMIGRLSEHILKLNPLLLKAMQITYAYVFLDEFQDTTNIQYDLTCTCFKDSNSILTAVGDDKQRIMLWAGAVQNVFQRFISDFGAISKQLISNYRSIPELVNIQHSIAKALNPNVEKTVSMVKGPVSGDVCKIYICDDDSIESTVLCGNILGWIANEKLNPRDVCILVRQTPQRYVEKLIDGLNQNGIKSRIENELQEILSEPITALLLSMLKLLILNKAPAEWTAIISFLSEAEGVDDDNVNDIERELGLFLKKGRAVIEKRNNWSGDSVDKLIGVLIEFLGKENIVNTYQQYGQGAYLDENISKISKLLSEYLGSMSWHDAIIHFEGIDSIPIMTLHKSKGLEFHTVVFIGLEDQALWNFNNNPDEETCGFFVAFSRAKKRVYMTASLKRPDRFGRISNQSVNSVRPLYDILAQAGIVPERVT